MNNKKDHNNSHYPEILASIEFQQTKLNKNPFTPESVPAVNPTFKLYPSKIKSVVRRRRLLLSDPELRVGGCG